MAWPRCERTAKLLALALLLQGCAANTQLGFNDKLSAGVKARSFGSYKEVLLIAPKEDPRGLAARAREELQAMGFKVTLVDASRPLEGAQGTGFAISAEGHVLTCAHVVGDMKEATLTLDGKRLMADVLKIDKNIDLALLKLREPRAADAPVLGFRSPAKGYSLGEDVFTLGYPLSSLLGNSARMSKGLVSATAGIRDDPRQLQVSAEIQPGNSGGPLLDREGNVLGVIQQTLNALRVAQNSGGALPQNVNFSIKNASVVEFVRSASPNAFNALRFDSGGGLDQASRAVAKVVAGNALPPEQRRDKMVVRLNYQLSPETFARLRNFSLLAFDYETQEPLFIAGQGREQTAGSAEAIVKDSFAQFRKAIASR